MVIRLGGIADFWESSMEKIYTCGIFLKGQKCGFPQICGRVKGLKTVMGIRKLGIMIPNLGLTGMWKKCGQASAPVRAGRIEEHSDRGQSSTQESKKTFQNSTRCALHFCFLEKIYPFPLRMGRKENPWKNTRHLVHLTSIFE